MAPVILVPEVVDRGVDYSVDGNQGQLVQPEGEYFGLEDGLG